MFALFATEAEARAFIARCDAALGYPCAGTPPAASPLGWTETWAQPIAHPDGTTFAVQVPEGDAVSVGGLGLVLALDDSWFPLDLGGIV